MRKQTDELLQFRLAMAELGASAMLARLTLDIVTADGRRLLGVPSRLEVDETHFGGVLSFEGAAVRLDEIVWCAACAPAAPTVVAPEAGAQAPTEVRVS